MNLNSTPASSTVSSSSVDTDEEIDQRVSIFLGVVEKAATLLYVLGLKCSPNCESFINN